ncbi:iron-dependent superoxide dismutase, putative [Perkinsus marinus ATCC 50983]|uniref:Superoxide dismutase n=1 Tax=Perkinsus marinus (strain ATCC 50983 / TXsc) TaxID=423536 RepID=C5LXB3_PERM5|nr:iron-dependent superoxide dismutase, putative [Perkinsus marinus ATCC 50983]EEQ98662.1 iron-dependent superoxide dismutase, putative [Perkinsus marinus ATCC 50983]|eukprot:XP_002765945.1 iron-dependent superoxide dismutase, putative [Perkinsus marinus ATCC 50983]
MLSVAGHRFASLATTPVLRMGLARCFSSVTGPFQCPPLPYVKNALEPHMSAETLTYHHDKHHQTYVDTLNSIAAENSTIASKTLEQIIKTETGKPFNQAAQVYNHTFFFNNLAPNGGGEPTGKIAELITRDFGSFEKFKEEFSAAAVGHFGSGWVWLIADDGKLKIVQGHDAGNPIRESKTPLMNIDVWEHAYYIDYRNARAQYVKNYWNLVNWDFVNDNVAKAGL